MILHEGVSDSINVSIQSLIHKNLYKEATNDWCF